jgi:hypothetical protein
MMIGDAAENEMNDRALAGFFVPNIAIKLNPARRRRGRERR